MLKYIDGNGNEREALNYEEILNLYRKSIINGETLVKSTQSNKWLKFKNIVNLGYLDADIKKQNPNTKKQHSYEGVNEFSYNGDNNIDNNQKNQTRYTKEKLNKNEIASLSYSKGKTAIIFLSAIALSSLLGWAFELFIKIKYKINLQIIKLVIGGDVSRDQIISNPFWFTTPIIKALISVLVFVLIYTYFKNVNIKSLLSHTAAYFLVFKFIFQIMAYSQIPIRDVIDIAPGGYYLFLFSTDLIVVSGIGIYFYASDRGRLFSRRHAHK
jgi:hypothetical protein